ncbi:MAG: hypothetical protein AAF723_08195 [Pseudomonadota bacterium]
MTDPDLHPLEEGRLRLAIQKSGRLADDTFDLLRQCGLKVRQSRTRLYARIEELPIDLLLVRDDDIPGLVASGASHIGIVGGNVYEEEKLSSPDGLSARCLKSLGFLNVGFVSLCPKGRGIKSRRI